MALTAHQEDRRPDSEAGRPLRILHLVGATADHGGILNVLRSIEEASRPLGWENTVLVHEDYRETRRPPLRYLHSRHLIDECSSHLRLLLQSFRALPEIRRLLRGQRFDVVHGHSRGALGVAIWMAAIARTPVVYTFHTRANRIGLYRWAAGLKHFETVLIAEDMVEYYQLPPGSPRVSVIPSACGQSFFERPLARGSKRSDPRSRFRLIGLGSLVRWKNWDLVPHAVARLPKHLRDQVEFQLWGQALEDEDSVRYARELQGLIDHLGLQEQVSLRGPTSNVAAVIEEADWLVHPTTNEPAGLGIAEAIAMGVPALVSASGGPKFTVKPGINGLHFQPGNVADLAAKLEDILEDRVRISPPAVLRESVRSRSAAAMVASLAKVYARALRA